MLSARSINFSEASMESGPSGSRMQVPMSMKTPARPTSNTLGFNTILRTNMKENTVNRAALLRTAMKPSAAPGTPGLKSSKAGLGGMPLTIKKNVNIMNTEMPNTTKMPRLLNLSNKTPFATHVAPSSPLDDAFSPLKAPFPISGSHGTFAEVPETILRPSRARTSIRMPRISDGSVQSNVPRTPDPSVQRRLGLAPSFADISAEVISGEPEIATAQNEIDFDDEVEYMPPKVQELPYDPGFDMPDYKELGAKIWRMGTVIDFRTVDGTRPREKPVALYPQDLVSLDATMPFVPTVNYEEDLSTYTSSKDLNKAIPASKVSVSQASSSTAPPPTSSKASRSLPSSRHQRTASASKIPVPPPNLSGHRRTTSQSTLASSSMTARPALGAGIRTPASTMGRSASSKVATSVRSAAIVKRPVLTAPTTKQNVPPPRARPPTSSTLSKAPSRRPALAATSTAAAKRALPPVAEHPSSLDDVIPELLEDCGLDFGFDLQSLALDLSSTAQ